MWLTKDFNSGISIIIMPLLVLAIGVILIAFGCCGWIRRRLFSNRGVKKEVLDSIPIIVYGDEHAANMMSECPICLEDYAAGEEIRVLPQCGHGFHVVCIDTWLRSHSACPNCRQIVVVAQ